MLTLEPKVANINLFKMDLESLHRAHTKTQLFFCQLSQTATHSVYLQVQPVITTKSHFMISCTVMCVPAFCLLESIFSMANSTRPKLGCSLNFFQLQSLTFPYLREVTVTSVAVKHLF